MKQTKAFIIILLAFLLENTIHAQDSSSYTFKPGVSIPIVIYPVKQKQINFFVVSKPKKGKIDVASRFNIVRTKIKSLLKRKKFVSIVAADASSMSLKIRTIAQEKNATIGTIWFDSHGMYKKGYSLFTIGTSEFNYRTIKDSTASLPLKNLAKYCNAKTNIVIGSCYGGATFHRRSLITQDTLRMNGDSLMIGLGSIYTNAMIYGSESWVMTKPGLFQKKASVAGFPLRKIFKDEVYRPAWEQIGKWNSYSAATGRFERINPVTMDGSGNIIVRDQSYTSKKNIQKRIAKNMKKIQPGLL